MNSPPPTGRPRLLFVTARLAETAVRRIVAETSEKFGFDYEVAVLNVNVAALLTVPLVARRLQVDGRFDQAILPGWCGGELAVLSDKFGFPFERGPKEIEDLPTFFGQQAKSAPDLSSYRIEILAEINHAPRVDHRTLLATARELAADGADVIDLGMIPDSPWNSVGDAVRMLREAGLRVSIDSFNRTEVEAAVAAGAELVLSCNSSNIDWAAGLPAELVLIPDDPHDDQSLVELVSRLQSVGAKFRIDPILEPIGFGFAASLTRYHAARHRWPELPMLMGVGNLSELTDVDSAGVNVLLAGFCEELRVESVLTTEVANHCRTAVREFDLARRLMKHAIDRGRPPKNVTADLIMLRDPRLSERSPEELQHLAESIRDPNFRIFTAENRLHLMNREGHWQGEEPFELFSQALAANETVSASHAFYLGYEMAKAVTALTLGKRYTQDQPLQWGFLTRPEKSGAHRDAHAKKEDDEPAE